jgi:ubiquinone/menaquinone biosynthesis C-methylase UbiE
MLRNLSRQSKDEYDVVIMQDALEHTNGYEKPVREALRVAKKRAIFTFWHLLMMTTPT